jgi:L-amino acid N-acyltransferase YncA
MQFTIEPVRKEDGNAIIDIFNYYVENSFAAYPEDPVPYAFFDFFVNMSEGYPSWCPGTTREMCWALHCSVRTVPCPPSPGRQR